MARYFAKYPPTGITALVKLLAAVAVESNRLRGLDFTGAGIGPTSPKIGTAYYIVVLRENKCNNKIRLSRQSGLSVKYKIRIPLPNVLLYFIFHP